MPGLRSGQRGCVVDGCGHADEAEPNGGSQAASTSTPAPLALVHEQLDDGWVLPDSSAARSMRAIQVERVAALERAVGAERNEAAVAAGRAARRAAAAAARRTMAHAARLAAEAAEREATAAAAAATQMRRTRSTSPRVDATHAVERDASERAPLRGWRSRSALVCLGAGVLGAFLAFFATRTAVSDIREAVRAGSVDALAVATTESPRARLTLVATSAYEAPSAATLYAPAPTFATHFADATAAAREGRVEDALDAVDRALAIRREGRALDLKATLLLDMEELDWALEVATEAVYTPPERAAPWLTKGILHHELDQPDRARFALEHYLDLRPTPAGARRARKILDSL